MKTLSLTTGTRAVQISALAFVGWLVWDGWALILAAVVVVGGFVFSYLLTRLAVGLQPAANEGELWLIFFATYLVALGILADLNSKSHAHPWWKDLELFVGGGFLALLLGALLWSALGRPGFK